MKGSRCVFRFCDQDGVHQTTLDQEDVPKKLPAGFELKRPPGKKKVSPRVLLFRTQDCDLKQSFYLETYVVLSCKAWSKNGWSVEKVTVDEHEEIEWDRLFSGESRIGRANQFLALSSDVQAKFGLLPARRQISLLLVSSKTSNQFLRPDFTFDHLKTYVVHVASTKKRREQERIAKEQQEAQQRRINGQQFMRELVVNTDDHFEIMDRMDSCHVNTGTASYQYEIQEKRQVFDVFGLYFGELLDAWSEQRDPEYGDFAERRLQSTFNPAVSVRVTGNDMRKVKRLLHNIDDAWWSCTFNTDVLHRIWFFYCLVYIKRERLCGRKAIVK